MKYFLFKGGVSAILSPNIIYSCDKLHYKWNIGIKIWQYCQLHEHEDPTNSQVPHAKGAIWLEPSGNEQKGFQFMSIKSARKIIRRIWDTILMNDTNIAHASNLA